MATLIGSLISIQELENIDKKTIKIGTILSLSSLILSILYYIIISKKHPTEQFIFDKQYIIFTIVFMIINVIITNLFIKRKKHILIAIIIFISIWGNYTVYKYSETGFKQNKKYKEYLTTKIDIDQVRTNSINCGPNLSAIIKKPNINTFNTNINGSNFEFYKSIDYERAVSTTIEKESPLNSFLSVEYIIDCETNKLEKINSKKMGIVYDQYIDLEEYNKLEKNEKIKTLLKKIPLNKTQIKEYEPLFKNKPSIKNNTFIYKNNGFEAEVEVTNNSLILYTIPYDKGWKATINKNKTKIENINGLVAIKLNKGQNKITFKYNPPGLKIGLIITILSLVIETVNIKNLLNTNKNDKNSKKTNKNLTK